MLTDVTLNERDSRSLAPERKWLDLSLAQQSIWLDGRLSGAQVYQLGRWARFSAPLDDSALRQALSLLMARHDALRLRVDDELPRQWMDASVEAPLSVLDWTADGDPDARFAAHVEALFASPMPLGDRALFEVHLIRAGKDLNFLLWRFHHLIADSISVSITLDHALAAYDALASGTARELAPPSSYLQTLHADAAYLDSAAYHEDLAWWSSRFDPLPPPLIAGMEARVRREPSVPFVTWTFEGEAFGRFEAAARQTKTSVQRALFALCAVALGRRYGQWDVVSGVALHRRDLANRHALGLMAGVIPVRCSFEPHWSLGECAQAFSEQLDADLRHQRLPVDILSRTLGLSGTGRAGLFEAVMSFMPASQRAANLDSLPVVLGSVHTKEASPISIHVAELPAGGVEVYIGVNPDFLDAGEPAALAALFQSAAALFGENPDTPAEELDTVPGFERALVVDEWNRTDAEFGNASLDQLFAEQVRRTPRAIAVIAADSTGIGYAELDARATRLARHLVAAGVGPERVVGVRMERSADTVIALLAILKAGGVYLPLDPAYPADRLEYMAIEAGAMLVLDSMEGLEGEAELPELDDPNRLAYIIYTSGTTGLPKGVAVSHVPPVNLAFARRACHDPLGPGDRVLAAISVGFDVSIGQLLLPLLSGAAVVIAGDLKTMGAAEFWAFLAERGVTHINSVPSFFDSILDAAPHSNLALKRLMLGGEPLSGALVARIQRALPGVEVVNMYGPTEACIDATYHVATAADLGAAVLPIGRPLSNYRAYVLDTMLDPVGVGVAGELYLGGEGVARGYVNSPELTAERFLADPFSATPGARLYRTGDRARWRADGRLEFLGRVDQQVKIRGFRVEPGEVAAALLGHPDVAQAAVVARATSPGAAPRLIAYWVPWGEAGVAEAAPLRDYLAARLPDYMVPSAFVAIAEIPLNRNGKLDAGALPSPDFHEGEYVAPRTPSEELLAGLFAEVLGIERCGATDHFFELGGHSLLATSLVSKLRRLGIELPLRAIFETPVVETLARRLDASLPSTTASTSLVVDTRPTDIPLSYPQERIWFVDRLQQDSSYNIPIAFELRGKLNVYAAERAIERIVQRHEILRTRIVLRGGRPAQQIEAPPALTFPRVDLSGSGPEAFREQLNRLAKHRFQLAEALPFEWLLIALDTERHVLAAVIHHVAFDGWSAGVFLSEFGALYNAFANGADDPLPPPAIQYADFALWQRAQDSAAHLNYWLEELRGAPAYLELPSHADSGVRSSGALPFEIDAALHRALLKLARERGASLFMVLHAAFAFVLSRWSGQDDVVIGTVTANRNRAELEQAIGCFVNTLPLRTKFKEGETFTQLLARVKSQDLAAYAHQEVAFEQLVQALHPERSLQHTPIFQVMLVLQNAPMPAADLPGLVLQPVPVEAEAAKFDLTLSLTEREGGLAGSVEYAEARFEPEAIARFAARLRRMLETVSAIPDCELAKIDLLDPAERALITEEWNRTAAEFEQGTLDNLFAAQVRRTPDGLAVVGRDGEEISYAELDARATRLARYLVEQGVEPERVVGVRMERSAETIVALLAILKAGGVYLPLDPAYPAERLDYIAKDAGAMLVLESADSLDGLDGDAELPELNNPDRLAYIIYTSGTTGLPKGVAVSHAAPVNLAFARRACHDPIGPGDRVLAAISVGFDVSIGQLLLPLLSGAAVVIAGDLKTMGAAEFWKLLADRDVTHINSVPSFFDSILDAAPAAGSIRLKRLMLGGEALSGALVERIQRALPGVEVVNMYGPTEACIDATYHVATVEDRSAAVLPIGRPLSNYQAYVLDASMQPVGIGVAGELYLGGAGLARGYVNAPELTAERFVPNPFSVAANARLYRTGDRARWREDGVIEFLGRADEQVKIRGFRVEPGEIEAQLRKVAGIREAAVIARTSHGNTRLIAYYTAEEKHDLAALREALAAALPDYMVPSAFVHLENLPLSPNGKLDRKALPEPGESAFLAPAYEPPRGPVEEKMAALWAELLKLERVGRNDNFFEMGGHSLLAVTLIERIQQEGLPGNVRALFATPTVAGLAATPAEAVGLAEAAPMSLVDLTPRQLERIAAGVPGGAENVQDIYPLSPLQEGILFQHLMTTDGDPYLTPFLLAFDTRARLDGFIDALNQLIARHDVLRTQMVWKDLDRPLQVVLREARLPVQEAVTLHCDPKLDRLDPGHAPLLRATVAYDPATTRWRLRLLTHHLVLDHTSMEILVHELRTLMANPRAVLPPSLPYRNFIAQTLSGVTAEAHEAFFTQLLAGVDGPTAPFGLVNIQSSDARTVEGRLTLDAALSQRIRRQARALGVTPASVFHLAWAAVLGHIAERRDVVFGTVLFGRMRSGAGADRVVGMFINTLPIRIELDGTGARESLLRTHRTLGEVMEHEHAPLALAQRCSNVPAPAPLFSSLFNYRYSPAQESGASWQGVEMLHAAERTNYPLAMAVDDSGASFHLTALGQPEAHPGKVCEYLQQALSALMDRLEVAPTAAMAALAVLPPEERQLVTEGWNRTRAEFEQGTLDGLFAAQVRRAPDALAVVGRDGEEISYGELDARATRLARYLVEQGVEPERVVGVRMERSAETIVALLAILKAGGVYLPLDPAYPAERLEYIAKDAGAMLVLESIDSVDRLDGDAELPELNDPNRLAYIIYTSGTTGLPKGVAVSHVAPVNLAFARRACHDPIGPGDRVLAAISVGFDVSIGQLLLPLLSGAAVVMAGDLKQMSGAEFWKLLAERGVTHINSVPSFFDSILDAAPAAGSIRPKRLMLGGEALSGALVERIQRALPGVEVVNMYGPTEACIDATYHVATVEDRSAAVLPIGRPLSNYQAYVLDASMQPVGIGVAGELYLGGAGLARGYVNALELTAERFVPDPFSTVANARLYRTGDRARWRDDGVIEFLGRVDEQVKIRGFRVEPGEIEMQLRKVAGIREAAVIARTAQRGMRLVAYYTAEEKHDLAALREALAAVLPDYMVPSAFVHLENLPLSPNGKLDRKALPEPGESATVAAAFEPPRGPVEEKMAALWAELLKLERVGRHDNFFELGGHSLLAVTLIERMQRQDLPGNVRALFTTPTVAGLAAAVAEEPRAQTPERFSLVELSPRQFDRIAAAVPGGAENVQDIYPLSPLQEGILFQHLMTAEGDPYLTPFLLAFDAREALDRFTSAINQVIARHDVLRTMMVWKDVEEPLQVVLRHAAVTAEGFTANGPDASTFGPPLAAELMERYHPRSYRIDLSRAPLLHIVTAHDPALNRWLLLMLTHHLVLDHTSVEILVQELGVLMANLDAQLPPSLPYRSFIAETRRGRTRADHEAFFSRMLGDIDEPTLPFGLLDTSSGASQILEGKLLLDHAISRRIREQARLLGVTPASLFHLAWAAVLRHVSGRSKVVFGTVLFGRMRSGAGADRVVGMFINTLPLRLDVDDTGIATSVRHTHERLAELLEHEHAPLALAQRCSAVPPPSPLFSSLFNYRHSPGGEPSRQPAAGIEIVDSFERTNYPLSMAVDDTGERFLLSALAVPQADPARVCEYLRHAVTQLAELLERAPETPIDHLAVLPAEERALVIEQWNQTEAEFARRSLDTLFGEQARRTPDALAILSSQGHRITYGELDIRSTRLARQLAARGVGTERVVGVRMKRSPDTVIALLAILKAGGVYLPLDPAYPPERLEYMAADAGAMLILDSLHGFAGEAGLPKASDPNRTAYIIYTSGTTGMPKGVAVSHGAPVNLAFARRAGHDPIGPGDRVLAAISVGFDVSIGQLLLPLLSGAAVVVAGDLKTTGAAEFWKLLAERQVTHINSVPSFFDSVLDAAPAASSLPLKRLMLGGEPLSGALVVRIRKALPGVEVVNMYGPTETCIDATFHIATDADLSAPVLPIGKPLSNYRAYVLDDRLAPAGVGVAGELYIGGAGLARGYINAPELTALRFVADPFSGAEGARLYRTGDRARWRADGCLEFLGRVDRQIKIRGFRVEPGEIAAALLKHRAIAQAVVVPRAGKLVAYVVTHPAELMYEPLPEAAALRAWLAETLPDYMLPSAFVPISAIPLNRNGKLDVSALPPHHEEASQRAYEPPIGREEEVLQGVWQSILGMSPVGRRDRFFDLGGDSLTAMRLVNAVNAELGSDLPMRVLFENPTIASMAAALRCNIKPKAHRALVALQPHGDKRKLFCIHPAGGHVFCYLPLARALGSDQPLYGLQASGLEEGEPLAASIGEMAADYIEAIRLVQPDGPYQLLGMSSGGLIAFEMARQIRQKGGEVSFLGLLDTTVPDQAAAFSERMVIQGVAGEFGCADLVETAPDSLTLEELVEKARRAGRLPEGFSLAQAERIAGVFRNTVRMHFDYQPRAWPGSLLLVRALRRLREGDLPPDWTPYAQGPLEVVDFDCGHSDLVSPQFASAVAEVLESRLRERS